MLDERRKQAHYIMIAWERAMNSTRLRLRQTERRAAYPVSVTLSHRYCSGISHSLTPLSFNRILACIFPSNSLKDFIIQRLSIMKNGPNYQDWFRIIKTDYGVGPIFIIQGLGCSHKHLQGSQHLSIESCLKKRENSWRVQKSAATLVDLQLTHTSM